LAAEDFLVVREEAVWKTQESFRKNQKPKTKLRLMKGIELGLDKSQAISTSAVPRSSPLKIQT
jgi:hypothetical protein